MKVRTARGLAVVGAVGLTVGLANIVAPGRVFPSRMTCVSDSDLLMCYIYPWAPAPWLVLMGAVAIAAGWALRARRRASADASRDDTR